MVGPSSDCIPIKHLVGVRRLSCNIAQLDSADYQALLPSGEISSTPCCSFSSSTFLVVDSRFLNQILSALEKRKTQLVHLVGRSLRKIGSFGVLPCVGVGLELNFQCKIIK